MFYYTLKKIDFRAREPGLHSFQAIASSLKTDNGYTFCIFIFPVCELRTVKSTCLHEGPVQCSDTHTFLEPRIVSTQ